VRGVHHGGSCQVLTDSDGQEANEYIEMGCLNGLFVLGRTTGFIGHYLDQKRLKQGLYRHPWEDIVYLSAKDAPTSQ
jgi:citrate synthase